MDFLGVKKIEEQKNSKQQVTAQTRRQAMSEETHLVRLKEKSLQKGNKVNNRSENTDYFDDYYRWKNKVASSRLVSEASYLEQKLLATNVEKNKDLAKALKNDFKKINGRSVKKRMKKVKKMNELLQDIQLHSTDGNSFNSERVQINKDREDSIAAWLNNKRKMEARIAKEFPAYDPSKHKTEIEPYPDTYIKEEKKKISIKDSGVVEKYNQVSDEKKMHEILEREKNAEKQGEVLPVDVSFQNSEEVIPTFTDTVIKEEIDFKNRVAKEAEIEKQLEEEKRLEEEKVEKEANTSNEVMMTVEEYKAWEKATVKERRRWQTESLKLEMQVAFERLKVIDASRYYQHEFIKAYGLKNAEEKEKLAQINYEFAVRRGDYLSSREHIFDLPLESPRECKEGVVEPEEFPEVVKLRKKYAAQMRKLVRENKAEQMKLLKDYSDILKKNGVEKKDAIIDLTKEKTEEIKNSTQVNNTVQKVRNDEIFNNKYFGPCISLFAKVNKEEKSEYLAERVTAKLNAAYSKLSDGVREELQKMLTKIEDEPEAIAEGLVNLLWEIETNKVDNIYYSLGKKGDENLKADARLRNIMLAFLEEHEDIATIVEDMWSNRADESDAEGILDYSQYFSRSAVKEYRQAMYPQSKMKTAKKKESPKKKEESKVKSDTDKVAEKKEDAVKKEEKKEEKKEVKKEEKKEVKKEIKKEVKKEENKDKKDKKDSSTTEKKAVAKQATTKKTVEKKTNTKKTVPVSAEKSAEYLNSTDKTAIIKVDQKGFQAVHSNRCWAFTVCNMLKARNINVEPEAFAKTAMKRLPHIADRIKSKKMMSVDEFNLVIEEYIRNSGQVTAGSLNYLTYACNIVPIDNGEKTVKEDIKKTINEAVKDGSTLALYLPNESHYVTVVGMINDKETILYKDSINYKDGNKSNFIRQLSVDLLVKNLYAGAGNDRRVDLFWLGKAGTKFTGNGWQL